MVSIERLIELGGRDVAEVAVETLKEPQGRTQTEDGPELINKAQRMYDARQFTMAEIAQSCAVTPITIYHNIKTNKAKHP